MEATRTFYRLTCRTCFQHGELWITDARLGGWAFATVGFVGLAVNRYNPQNSVLRCNGCWGPHVTVAHGGPVAPTPQPASAAPDLGPVRSTES
jgi:hypothetical protein